MTASERRALLDEYLALLERLRMLSMTCDVSEGEKKARAEAAIDPVQERISKLWDLYVAGLPALRLSRCPFSGAEVRLSIDSCGLDGLFWNHDAPARKLEPMPPTFFALAGAVRLGSQIESAPFLAKPGPEAPWVVPRLLARSEIKAVVSFLPVGPHVAYPIFYFADPIPRDVERVNTWGTSDCRYAGPFGEPWWSAVHSGPEDYDFDLRPWIRAGKLLWIAPGDSRGALRSVQDDCPFLDLPGRRYPLCIERGKVWSAW